MAAKDRKIRRHIISLRVSAEEWDILREVMQGLEYRSVSDLMREAFKLVAFSRTSSGNAAS